MPKIPKKFKTPEEREQEAEATTFEYKIVCDKKGCKEVTGTMTLSKEKYPDQKVTNEMLGISSTLCDKHH